MWVLHEPSGLFLVIFKQPVITFLKTCPTGNVHVSLMTDYSRSRHNSCLVFLHTLLSQDSPDCSHTVGSTKPEGKSFHTSIYEKSRTV